MNKIHTVLIGVILFFVVTNVIWIIQDQAPPMWDQSHYLGSSEVLYSTLTKKGLISLIPAFARVLDTKAPLITVLPMPFYLLFGKNYTSALYVNIIFLIIGSHYLYRLGALMSDKKEAVVSVIILNTFPLIFGLSREFLVEYGLMVFVIVWMYYFIKSEGFENRKYNYPLGVVLGLGMLMKITFALYIIFPAIFVLVKGIREKRGFSKLTVSNIFYVVLIGLLISGMWYLNNFRAIIKYVISAGYGEVAKYYGLGSIFSLKTVLAYWMFVINYGISSYYFILIIFLLIPTLLIFMKNKTAAGYNKTLYFYYLMIWLTIPFIIFTFGMSKDYRFTAPLYPALALLMGVAFMQLYSRKYGKVLFILLFIPLFNYMYISFSSSEPFVLEVSQFRLLSNRLFWAHPPVKEQWPNDKLLESIHQNALDERRYSARVVLLFDHPYVNGITLNYFAKNNYSDITFATNDLYLNEHGDKTIDKIRTESDYVITKSDRLGNYSLVKNTPTISQLNEGKTYFRQLKILQLPDQTFLAIYKKLT